MLHDDWSEFFCVCVCVTVWGEQKHAKQGSGNPGRCFHFSPSILTPFLTGKGWLVSRIHYVSILNTLAGWWLVTICGCVGFSCANCGDSETDRAIVNKLQQCFVFVKCIGFQFKAMEKKPRRLIKGFKGFKRKTNLCNHRHHLTSNTQTHSSETVAWFMCLKQDWLVLLSLSFVVAAV